MQTFAINFQLSKKQSASLERIANSRSMSTTEMLDEVTSRAINIVEEMLLKPLVNPVAVNPVADEIERGLKGIAASAGKDLETVKDNLMDSRKAAKYRLDTLALQAYQQHITKQRTKK